MKYKDCVIYANLIFIKFVSNPILLKFNLQFQKDKC